MKIPLIGGTKGRAPVTDYNEVNLLELDSVKEAKVDFWIAKQIGEKLVEKYPNRQWAVDADCRNQMVIIMCPSLSTKSGYYMPMRRDTIADLQRRAVIAAGEILERFGVTRGKIVDPNSFDHMPQDTRGNVIAPDAKPEPIH
jgi:hypothetical protein